MNRTGVLATIALALLVLAGCGSGQTAPANGAPAAPGVDGQVGPLRLLHVVIASPGGRGSIHIDGDSAALLLTVANDGKSADALTGARTDVAGEVKMRTGDATAGAPVEVPVPAGGTAVLSEVTGPHLELSGLRTPLRAGASVPVTFEFRTAGPVTLTVPVTTYTDVRPDKYLPLDAAG